MRVRKAAERIAKQIVGSDMLVEEYDMVDDKPDVVTITPNGSPDEAETDSNLPEPEPAADDCEGPPPASASPPRH